ncbi:MAG: DUF3618 domain-containing protein [Thermoleophilia bacterium]|nr:DUF3618 domain-containing protein [Thermoleophilia bacterium]
MAQNHRTAEDVRREIEAERGELARAVEELRSGIGEATNISAKLQSKLPVAAAAALGAGFLLAGGIGATARLLFRRRREGHEWARLGRFVVSERD